MTTGRAAVKAGMAPIIQARKAMMSAELLDIGGANRGSPFLVAGVVRILTVGGAGMSMALNRIPPFSPLTTNAADTVSNTAQVPITLAAQICRSPASSPTLPARLFEVNGWASAPCAIL